MEALKHLRQLSMEQQRKRYPNFPEYAITPKQYTDKTANGLTKCIIDFIRYTGNQAERINSTGRLIDRRQTVTDVIGRQRTIGNFKWVYGTGTKGTADVSATIDGRSLKVEIKTGRDRQSEAQKQYQKNIEQSGGIYYIARNFQGFVNWYNKKFHNETTT